METLLSVIERELRQRGYEPVEADPVALQTDWRGPDGEVAELTASVLDCLEREEGAELSDLYAKQLGPFVAKSETSRKASLDAYPRQGSQRRRLITALAYHGASTREELAGHTSLSENSVRPRVRELIDGGWIEETDHTRMTTRGSDAALLDLTFKAREQLGAERHARADA